MHPVRPPPAAIVPSTPRDRAGRPVLLIDMTSSLVPVTSAFFLWRSSRGHPPVKTFATLVKTASVATLLAARDDKALRPGESSLDGGGDGRGLDDGGGTTVEGCPSCTLLVPHAGGEGLAVDSNYVYWTTTSFQMAQSTRRPSAAVRRRSSQSNSTKRSISRCIPRASTGSPSLPIGRSTTECLLVRA